MLGSFSETGISLVAFGFFVFALAFLSPRMSKMSMRIIGAGCVLLGAAGFANGLQFAGAALIGMGVELAWPRLWFFYPLATAVVFVGLGTWTAVAVSGFMGSILIFAGIFTLIMYLKSYLEAQPQLDASPQTIKPLD